MTSVDQNDTCMGMCHCDLSVSRSTAEVFPLLTLYHKMTRWLWNTYSSSSLLVHVLNTSFRCCSRDLKNVSEPNRVVCPWLLLTFLFTKRVTMITSWHNLIKLAFLRFSTRASLVKTTGREIPRNLEVLRLISLSF